METLIKIQGELKAPKNQFNSFGKYKYRSCEDILEALKPIAKENNALFYIDDQLMVVGDKTVLNASVHYLHGETSITVNGWAAVDYSKKGMDAAQCVGAASSYARKYALNALLLIDDTKDPDATNTHGNEKKKESKKLTVDEIKMTCESIDSVVNLNAFYKSLSKEEQTEEVVSMFAERKGEILSNNQ